MRKFVGISAAAIGLAMASPSFAQERPDDGGEVAFKSEAEEMQDKMTAEFEDAFALFGELFAADPLTEEQEARLPLAESLMATLFPEGAFAQVMQESMGPMMDLMLAAEKTPPRASLQAITNMGEEDLEALPDEDVAEALAIFDPQADAREERLGEVIVKLVGDMMGALEPAYRKGMSRALAVRVTEADMRALETFLATPAGARIGKDLFMVQYDPQVMGVMEEMGPAIAKLFPSMMTELAAMAEEFPEARSFNDLSEAERNRAATLLGKGVNELDALAEITVEITEESAEDPVA